MFIKNSVVSIADDNYVDTIDYPIYLVNRKNSIASYNFSQKILFYSHINKVQAEVKDAEFRLVKIMAVNTLGKVFTVVCDDNTEIGVARGAFVSYIPVNTLREKSSILIDSEGFLCKIISIEDYHEVEDKVYNIASNKGHNKFVNGLMFKA